MSKEYCDDCKIWTDDIIQHYTDEHNMWPELVRNGMVEYVNGEFWIKENLK